jgi:CheY-like chemotaxis protein/Tfp pilus assembly protein PilZ
MQVLVVDDNQTYREILRGLLAPGGYEVQTAASAAEALDAIRRTRPGLLLLDLYMPDGDGDALCRQLRADPRTGSLPILMMSGGGRKDEAERCGAAGCNEFLVKPIRQAELLQAICRHLYGRMRNVRISIRLPLTLESGGARSAASSVDLSLGGMFVETNHLLHPGTEMLVEFTLPRPAPAEPLLIRGEVAWLNQPTGKIKKDLPVGIGIQFTKMTPEAQTALALFLTAAKQAACP